MRHGPRESIEPEDYDGIHRPPSCISHQLIERRPFFLRPADSQIDVLRGHLPTAALGILA
jgi:hypothetical protein